MNYFGSRLMEWAVDRPRLVVSGICAITAVLVVLAVLPTVAPATFPMLSPIRVDTDPENMLDAQEPVRVFHNDMKREFALNEIIVVGVVNDRHPDGVFNPESLKRIAELTEYAKTLRGEAIGVSDPNAGVVSVDLIAPGTVDNIQPGGPGEVRFEWLMPRPPETREEALAVRDKAARLPFLQDTLVAQSGKAIALYLPITAKNLSYRISKKLQEKIASFGKVDDQFHITGLPVANDTFGVEMFVQMAISAPLAMLVIFLLMLYFFRKLVLIVAPMILAMIVTLLTMGLLVVTGNTIHIMSSMIPIFLMPISILDSIHILSEFFERYQQFKNRREAILNVMKTLFAPMLFTSLTSAAGFASLAITPIPPVQVFGIFVAIGVMIAWVFTITFIPAFIMLIPERKLEKFGAVHPEGARHDAEPVTMMGRVVVRMGLAASRYWAAILLMTAVITVIAVWGIMKIEVNDNPTRWFKPSHPIRVADTVLNRHFGGTYMAYLALTDDRGAFEPAAYAAELANRLNRWREDASDPGMASARARVVTTLAETIRDRHEDTRDGFLNLVITEAERQLDAADQDPARADEAAAWDDVIRLLDEERQRDEVFKQPDVLRWMIALQEAALSSGVVGKANSLADLVRTVYRELMEGDQQYFRIPDSSRGVAQCIITFESSHRPQDIAHFVTHDFRRSSIWMQLRSGDNRDMMKVVDAVNRFIAQNPPPVPLRPEWFGLTYINVVWQQKMVLGMLQSFLGSFLVVLFMMIVLFRSGIWGAISMVPLTVTIGAIYGVIGIVGKDYDMPVAVLSSLTLGLAVDFAIHFLSRSRELYQENGGDWQRTVRMLFGEPARAIVRNIIAVAIGFTPLLAAPLVPYNTVGIFMAAILFVSGIGTLILLPAIMRPLLAFLFPVNRACRITCMCGTCVITAATAAAAAVVNLQFLGGTWTQWSMGAAGAVLLSMILCFALSRRSSCAVECQPAGTVAEKQKD